MLDRYLLAMAVALMCCPLWAGEGVGPVISAGVRDEGGMLRHEVRSEFQAEVTELRVLLPEPFDGERRYPVVFVLPVEARDGRQYGDGLAEIAKEQLHRRYPLIFVAPTFSHLPWYADHPTDPLRRQETYFVEVVVPFVKRTYPVVAGADGVRLLGFSKSGWGSCSLLARHPELIGRVAVWDAPLAETEPKKYGMEVVFTSTEQFAGYRLFDAWERSANALRDGTRIGIFGYGSDNFRTQQAAAHDRLTQLNIPHLYRDGPKRPHTWHSGWLPEAVAFLGGE